MKLISYSLFNAPCEPFEKMVYIRGFYWNSRMNNLIYPDWRTHLEISYPLYAEFSELFLWLKENNNLSIMVNGDDPALCEGMIWRMKPIWTQDVSHVLCRDSDAITTYKEAQYIQSWLESGVAVSSIHDNPAHSGLMGGMVGFDTASFKALTQINSFDELISNRDLSERGSDQHLLNTDVMSKLRANPPHFLPPFVSNYPKDFSWPRGKTLPLVDERLWESNLTCRHIGSAGVVEMETIRFFKRFDEYQWKFDVIEKQFPKLFYWHL